MSNKKRSAKISISVDKENIRLFNVFMPKSVIKPLQEVLFNGYIGEGPKVEIFERKLAAWFKNENILALNNGTSAIHLALRLANVGSGDEVISTPMTCVATNEPILAMGARIIWADIDPWTGNIDPADVAKKITSKTKAIICVHWGGYPCDLKELNAIANKHGIKLIEDACHAFGSVYCGKSVGSHSDFVCFSFQAIKAMTTVDGGALACKTKSGYERGRLLRWYGIDRTNKQKDMRYEIDIPEYGYKFHMNDVTATIGIEQLKYVGNILKKTRLNAAQYDKNFKGMNAVRLLNYKNDRLSSFWLYTIRVKNRPDFIKFMNENGIMVSLVHGRNDKYTVFKDSLVRLPGLDEFTKEYIAIPVGWWLTKSDVSRIIDAVRQYDRFMTGK